MSLSDYRQATISLDDVELVENICNRFENALGSDQLPKLESFVDSVPEAVREAILVELLILEKKVGERAGKSFDSNDYRRRFPQYHSAIDWVASRPSKPGDTVTVAHQSSVTQEVKFSDESASLAFGKVLPDGKRMFGRFELRELLGQGAFGAVYRAYDPQLDRDVAIKIPRAGTLHDNRAAQRFLREARAAAQLRHPNIVPIHDAGQIDGTYYIASGFIKGKNLREVMNSSLPSPRRGTQRVTGAGGEGEHQAATLISKLAAALHYAHTQGIIHRDVKPENIMVDESGEPHVMDFGLALRQEGKEHLTRDGAQMGTPAYMSPEQARGDSHFADAGSDLWSLGVMLYELLTGQLPFTARSFEALMLEILQREPTRLRTLKPTISKDLDTICQKCLTKEPAKRYATCAQFADDLARSMRGESITARRISRIERIWRWANRHPALAVTSAALFLLFSVLAIGGPLVAWRQSRLKSESDQLAKEKGSLLAEQTKANDALRTSLIHQLIERGSSAMAEGNSRNALALFADAVAQAPDQSPLRRSTINLLVASENVAPIIMLHSKEVSQVAFSPSGDCVLTASNYNPGPAQLWDASTGKPIGEPLRHEGLKAAKIEGVVNRIAFSANGDIALTGSTDGTARLWHARTGNTLGVPMEVGYILSSVAFSPSGDRILTASGMTVQLWSVETCKAIGRPMQQNGSVHSVVFSPRDDRLLIVSDDTAQLWDARTGNPLGEPMRHQGTVISAVFDRRGDRVLTGAFDGTARVWDAQTGKQIGKPMRHGGEVMSVAVSHQGDRVLTLGRRVVSNQEGEVQLWDAETYKPIGEKIRATSVAFSPTGDRFLTGSNDGAVRLWDALTAKPIEAPPMRHEGFVSSVAFSPTGDRVLTGSLDKTARIWNLKFGKPHREPICLKGVGGIRFAAFSPTDDWVFTAGSNNTTRFWNVRNSNPIGEPLRHDKSIECIAISPTGDRVLTGSSENAAWIWNAKTGKPIGETIRHEDAVKSVAFSPRGDRVLTGSEDWTARLWHSESGKPIGEPMRHGAPVNIVTFSPTGDLVLTTSLDKTARLWDAETGKPMGEPKRHEGRVASVAFSPTGDCVLTGSSDNTARLWDGRTGKPVGEPLRHNGWVSSVAFNPTGNRVLTGSWDETARLWDAQTGKPIGEPMRHAGFVNSVAFSPDGNRVLTGSDDETAHLWDAQTGKPIGEPMPHDSAVRSVAFNPTGDRVLVCSENGMAWLWDAHTGRPIGKPMLHEGVDVHVKSAAFSPTRDHLLTGSRNKTAQLWNSQDGEPIGEPMMVGKSWVEAVAFSSTGERVLTGSYDGIAKVWDAQNGRLIGEPFRHEEGAHIRTAAFSPAGDCIVTGSSKHVARIWDVKTGEPIGEPMRHEYDVVSVAFSPTADRILTGSSDGTARLWHVKTGKPAGEPLHHENQVLAVAFNPTGTRVLTGSRDNTARIWEADTGKLIGEPMRHVVEVNSVAFSPTGDRVVTGSLDGNVRLWDAQTGKPLGQPLHHEGEVVSVAFCSAGDDAVLTVSKDGIVRRWNVPEPPSLNVTFLALWSKVRSGSALDEQGQIHNLPQEEWLQAWTDFQKVGADYLSEEKRRWEERVVARLTTTNASKANIGPKERPAFDALELAGALADVTEVRAKLADAAELDTAARKKLMGQQYRKLYRLGEVVTFTSDLDADTVAVANLLADLGADLSKLSEIGTAATQWFTSPDKRGKDNGVLLAGKVQEIAKSGAMHRVRILMAGGKKTPVSIYSPTKPDLAQGDSVLVLGTIVVNPKETMHDFIDDEPTVVWHGLSITVGK